MEQYGTWERKENGTWLHAVKWNMACSTLGEFPQVCPRESRDRGTLWNNCMEQLHNIRAKFHSQIVTEDQIEAKMIQEGADKKGK